MNTFDPMKFDIVFAAINLNDGLVEGTALTISPAGPAFIGKPGLDGKVTRTRKHSRMRTGKLVVKQNSPINDRLSAIHESDRVGLNGQGIGVFFVQDRAGTTKFRCAKAYISQEPDLIIGGEAGEVTWTFEFPNGDITHGSNPDD